MAAGTSSGQRRARTLGGRAVRVVVRVTAEEYAALSTHAEQAGQTVPSYLAALGLNPQQVPAGELRSALTHATALRRLLTAALARADLNVVPQDDIGELRQQAQAAVARLDALTTRR